MHFVSTEYAVLLTLTVIVYWLLPWRRARLALLLVASYIFYMSWSQKLVALLWFSTLLDFVCGGRIHLAEDDRIRRRWLYCSLVGNLGVLGLFKYYGFFVDSFIALMRTLGVDAPDRTIHFILPLGISFYTFQTLSYTIDIYRRHLRPSDSVLEFALFVAFFPQLVAGPIVRARDFLPQAAHTHRLNSADILEGLDQVFWGIVKKAVIADNLAQVVDYNYSIAAHATSTQIWMAALAFYGQLYCDFSGYSDIAIGSARLFGFRIKPNFTKPYLTTNPQAYWQHWHISLNTWLRDYVYFPLGGNRKGPRWTYVNLFITMFLSGLWHGAAWTYVIWGSYHALCLIGHRVWANAGYRLPLPLAILGQLAFNVVGFLMFRAESWANMTDVFRAAAAPLTAAPSLAELGALAWCALVFFVEPFGSRYLVGRGWLARFVWLRPLLWGGAWTVLFALAPPTPASFVYFVF